MIQPQLTTLPPSIPKTSSTDQIASYLTTLWFLSYNSRLLIIEGYCTYTIKKKYMYPLLLLSFWRPASLSVCPCSSVIFCHKHTNSSFPIKLSVYMFSLDQCHTVYGSTLVASRRRTATQLISITLRRHTLAIIALDLDTPSVCVFMYQIVVHWHHASQQLFRHFSVFFTLNQIALKFFSNVSLINSTLYYTSKNL